MKFQLLLTLFFVSCFNISAQETYSNANFRAGLIIGASTSQVDGDTYGGYNKIGLTAGSLIRRRFSEKWEGEFQMVYIQKGARKVPKPEKADFSTYLVNLDYIEVPFLAKYFHKNFIIETGLSIGVLVREKEVNHIQNITGDRPFSKQEYAFTAGLSYPITEHLTINGRYSYSIFPIRQHASGISVWFNRGQANNVISFNLQYAF